MTAKNLIAQRIRELPPYLFAEIDRVKSELKRKGTDIIDLSIGDPDLPTPEVIVKRLCDEAKNAAHHRYPSYAGSERFREAAAQWYIDRFGVPLDPATEVLALIGSKEGIAHAPLAFVNPGDVALMPSIGYPVYATATSFAGGIPELLPVDEENQFHPRIQDVSAAVAKRTKLLFLNFPNNPTSAVVQNGYFDEIVAFAKKHEILVCHDNAYSEVTYDGYNPPSFLSTPGAKEVGIEFHSLSKTFNMTGWRIGFVVGRRAAIAALGKVKTNVDSGVFTAIQEAGIVALSNWKSLRDTNNSVYAERRDAVCGSLRDSGLKFYFPRATFYVWCRVPTTEPTTLFCGRILEKTGVCLTPGIGFGPGGEGYYRISLTAPKSRLEEAMKRVVHAL